MATIQSYGPPAHGESYVYVMPGMEDQQPIPVPPLQPPMGQAWGGATIDHFAEQFMPKPVAAPYGQGGAVAEGEGSRKVSDFTPVVRPRCTTAPGWLSAPLTRPYPIPSSVQRVKRSADKSEEDICLRK